MNMISESVRAVAKVICRYLTPAARAKLVRDSIPAMDLVDHLPKGILIDLLLKSADRLGMHSICFDGDLGRIEGSPRDKVILRRYALEGTWSSAFQTEIVQNIYGAEGGSFIDVGANIGLTSIPIAKNHRVNCYAIEPDPLNFSFLKRNAELNGVSQDITILNFAAYDRETELTFELSPDNLGDHRIRRADSYSLVSALQDEERRRTIQVKAALLDKMVSTSELRHPLLVKVDTQGSEPMVFRGAGDLLAETDCLVVEFSPYTLGRAGFDVDDFFSSLKHFTHGYVMALDTLRSDPRDRSTRKPELFSIKDIITLSRQMAMNKHPDNYVDLVLVKKPDLLFGSRPD